MLYFQPPATGSGVIVFARGTKPLFWIQGFVSFSEFLNHFIRFWGSVPLAAVNVDALPGLVIVAAMIYDFLIQRLACSGVLFAFRFVMSLDRFTGFLGEKKRIWLLYWR